MDILSLVVSLLSGAAGGNAAGAALKEKTLGTAGNTIVGGIGGGTGHWLLQLLGVLASAATTATASGAVPVPGTEGLNIGALLGNIVGSGAGGAVLTTVIALLKQMLQDNSSGHSDK